MSFVVTARKWRPQKFEEVVGQQHISQTLKNAISNNRIAHAYLFAGPRGIGKTTTARIFAKAINCLNLKNGEPCNECTNCNLFNSSQSIDIIEIDGASNRRIDEIRVLRDSVKYAPMNGKYKIYIIDEVHMLTTESFNALLKTLEEPPEHVVFIFATTDVHKVPLTIISRCQRFDFRRIEVGDIKNLLQKISDVEDIKIDETSLTLIAKKADGALRDAQSLFDQVASFCNKNVTSTEVAKMFNLIDEDIYFRISDAILQKNFKAAFEITQLIYENGWNFIDFGNELLEHFRNILTVVIRKDTKLIATTESTKNKFLTYIDAFSEADILRILNFINKYSYEIKTTNNPKLKTEFALSTLIGLESSKSISSLLQALENGIPLNESKKKVVKSDRPIKESVQNHDSVSKIDNSNKTSSLNITTLKNNWSDFIKNIESEKFTLANHLSLSEPIELIGKKLKVAINHKDDIEVIMQNENFVKYLTEKSLSYFNQKLTFELVPRKSQEQNKTAKQSLDEVDFNLSENEKQIIEAIKQHLGGKKVN